jgi:hypothetical protein
METPMRQILSSPVPLLPSSIDRGYRMPGSNEAARAGQLPDATEVAERYCCALCGRPLRVLGILSAGPYGTRSHVELECEARTTAEHLYLERQAERALAAIEAPAALDDTVRDALTAQAQDGLLAARQAALDRLGPDGAAPELHEALAAVGAPEVRLKVTPYPAAGARFRPRVAAAIGRWVRRQPISHMG